MEQGWDPDVKRFFQKILNSIGFGLFWMMSFVGVGLYAGFAIPGNKPQYAVIIFYVIMTSTFILLGRYYLRSWNKRS